MFGQRPACLLSHFRTGYLQLRMTLSTCLRAETWYRGGMKPLSQTVHHAPWAQFYCHHFGLKSLTARQEKGKDGKEFLALYFSGFCSHRTKVESIAAVNSFLKKKLGIGKSRGLETWQQLFPTTTLLLRWETVASVTTFLKDSANSGC